MTRWTLWLLLCGCAPLRPDADDDDAGDDDAGDDDAGDDDTSDDPFGGAVALCTPGGDPGAWWWREAWLDGERLGALLEIGGGCETHEFALCWDGSFMESWPVQVRLDLRHRGLPDPCDAIVTQELSWDLTPLAEAYAESYGTNVGTITVNAGDWSLPWSF